MTDRYDALTYALAELISAHKVISNTPDFFDGYENALKEKSEDAT